MSEPLQPAGPETAEAAELAAAPSPAAAHLGTVPPAVDGTPPPLAAPPDRPGSTDPAGGADPLLGELRHLLGDAIPAESDGAGSSDRVAAGAADAAEATHAADAVDAVAGAGGDLTILVRREDLARVAAALRSRFRYTQLVDLCAADYPLRALRFEVVYHLYSFRENRRIRLLVRTDERSPVPSVTGIWRAAGWPEREARDLFGVVFAGHPDPTPLLLWEGFQGHPLRKDFPLAGVDTGAARSERQ